MKLPLSWLSEFMEINHSVDEYVEMLNQLGLEVEGVEEVGEEISGVILVDVLETHPHPNADKLKLVDIDTGKEKKQIVCGAPNVRAGLKVPYAPSGATLPGGFRLSEKEIRGIISDGMLCSPRELGLGEDHSGIYELPLDAPVGGDAVEYLQLRDTIIDLSITPNRPDAMSIVGLARELCAAFNQKIKLPNLDNMLKGIEVDSTLPKPQVAIEDDEKCPRLVAAVASVETGPSPIWMSRRLNKVGVRSISNVVDVTNYVLMEWGRPLHAFDLESLGEAHIIAKRAADGEKTLSLDGVERELTNDDLVIADSKGVTQAIAGVMGGATSEVHENTKLTLIESAYFQPETISRTSKRLGLRSEASARFERGIDPNFTLYGVHRALQLLAKVANAKMADAITDVYPEKIESKTIHLRTARVERVLGDAISDKDIEKFLEPLVVSIKKKGDGFDVVAPTYRPDLVREIDLIEEVARRRGLNSFEPTLPNSLVQIGGLNREQKRRRAVEDALCGAGLMEAYSLPLEAEETYAPFGYGHDDIVHTKNALKSDASILRPVIVPGLARSVQRNIARGIDDVAFFEIGHVFNLPFDENLQPKENLNVAVVLNGNVDERPVGSKRSVDVFDAIDYVRIIINALHLEEPQFEESQRKGYHPTRCANVIVKGVNVGVVGELLNESKMVACELDLDALLGIEEKDMDYVPQSQYPFVAFDLALVVDSSVKVQDLLNSMRKHGGKELEDISLFDVYEGEKLGKNKKSVAFALRVRPQEGTWSDEDLANYREVLLTGLKSDCNAELR